MPRHFFVVVGLLLGLAVQVQGQTVNRAALWPGQKVLPKVGCVVKICNKTIDVSKLAMPWVVRVAEGDWLWIGGPVSTFNMPRKEWVQSGIGWVQQSQVVTLWNDANPYYTELIKENPNNALAYKLRGIAWAANRSLDMAIADYDEAIRISPSASVYNYRASP